MLMGPLLWHVCSGLPMGDVNIVNTIRVLIDARYYEFIDIADCFLWVLVFIAWIFAGIVLISGDSKISSVALFVLGGLFIVENILIMFLAGMPRYLLELISDAAIILTAITLLKRKEALRKVTYIVAVIGFLADLAFRIIGLRTFLSYSTDYTNNSQYIARLVIVIGANLMLMLGLILACRSVDCGAGSAAKKPYAGQPQQPYTSPYAGQQQQAQYTGQAQSPYASPYAGQSQQPYASPYVDQQQAYASPYAGQSQPYASPYADQQQPYASPYDQPQADAFDPNNEPTQLL